MKKIFIVLLSFTFSSFIVAQQTKNIDLFLDDDGNISLETKYLQTAITDQQIREWISSFPDQVNGKIEYLNSNSGEFRYKGHVPISLSERPSVFQIEMHFTLSIHSAKDQLIVTIGDIYYQSYPEYGKQGTPAIISYPKDWYSKAKLRKKTGNLPWLNSLVKENTISKAEELLAAGNEFFICL
ncbi:hypothetical protein [Labilibaculum euxinus]|uniref:DUF4468 domain-containing protein n=1 Tax=Labilibaculum euxinus TaxID=2686357 RepID=A0A7M4DBM0_9BACT|nr:hypothetical protein [Labilibaculum euxinus]MUP40049.1 hypothetical protein [Labilibaculum euxinus]MVB09254.1 hypothetical protein [Labilibaculum euxinus]